jgi:anion-transporting  ArsA/GET3 family ATPase
VDLHQFFTASRVLVVAGKGGVGKTTVSAVIARAAAHLGLRVLVIDLEGKSALAELLGGDSSGPLPYADTLVDGALVSGRTITPSGALAEYLDDHGLRRVSRRLVDSGIIEVVSTAAPGIDDILVLGKIKQIERGADGYDLIVVDGPAAGHAITFLQAARGLEDAVRSGPIRAQAHDVLSMLGNPRRCQVVLVTLPEATPVNEVVETAYALEDRVGVQLAPVVVNCVDPGLDEDLPGVTASRLPGGAAGRALRAAAAFRTDRRLAQRAELDRLSDQLALAQVRLPMITTAGLTAAHIDDLARHLLVALGHDDAVDVPGAGD